MNQAASILILLACFSWKYEAPEPLFFAMEKEYLEVSTKEELFQFEGVDSSLQHELVLLKDEEGKPLLFFSDILTPVCIEGLCKPMYIYIYWNLVGSYVGYGTLEKEPLTKFDHEVFEEADHNKLHHLLLNDKSVLQRKKLSDLFDGSAGAGEAVRFKGVEVDAVSGATKKEIKASLVEGALYSCYTIWHLVHGPVKEQIRTYLDSIYTDELARYLLYSNYNDYQLYALKSMPPEDMKQHLDRIASLLPQAPPLTRTYLLKKLPKELLREPAAAQMIYRAFGKLDVNSKTLLIRYLKHAAPPAAEVLAESVQGMTKNQLQIFLDFLRQNQTYCSAAVKSRLERALELEEYHHGYLIKAFLSKIR